jgi:3-methylcrotonyl-CoA carboxylase alpha subunit
VHGHAIEARICAENPDANFLPATGTLDVLRWPHARELRARRGPRVDAAACARATPSAALRLDDRQADRLGRPTAHRRWRGWTWRWRRRTSSGLHTNVAFLRRVVASRPSPPPTSTPR